MGHEFNGVALLQKKCRKEFHFIKRRNLALALIGRLAGAMSIIIVQRR